MTDFTFLQFENNLNSRTFKYSCFFQFWPLSMIPALTRMVPVRGPVKYFILCQLTTHTYFNLYQIKLSQFEAYSKNRYRRQEDRHHGEVVNRPTMLKLNADADKKVDAGDDVDADVDVKDACSTNEQ